MRPARSMLVCLACNVCSIPRSASEVLPVIGNPLSIGIGLQKPFTNYVRGYNRLPDYIRYALLPISLPNPAPPQPLLGITPPHPQCLADDYSSNHDAVQLFAQCRSSPLPM